MLDTCKGCRLLGGELLYEKEGSTPPAYGLKKAVLAPLWVFSLKRSMVEAFTVPFRVLSRKNMTGDIWQSIDLKFCFIYARNSKLTNKKTKIQLMCCFWIDTSLVWKNFQATPTKQDLGIS